ncbi:tripartite tricarboxylate transporter permease [Natrarchaeobius sp. A-rgal3]|uniref:tripartite tricarboxylate transporter permease n=1 Tax=Natrarchaeobius versutus TaxID=1679078 RepID=UPI00350FCA2C
MSQLAAALEGLATLFTWPVFWWMIVGVLVGIVAGALPGIGAGLGMAIILPLTLPLDGTSGLVFLIGVYSGAMYGGSISAILINTPGTGGSAATTLDGYPMSRAGLAKNATAISVTASVLGGSVGLLTLLVLLPVLVEVILAFQSPEYFMVAVVGLALIPIVAQGSLFKGLLSGALGLLIATVGIAPMQFQSRYTFDTLALDNGISYIAALIGLFAIAEMITLSKESGGIAREGIDARSGSVLDGIRTAVSKPVTVIKSAYIGMAVGAIPGGGSTIANFVAYSEAVRASKDGDGPEFGEGNPTGVVATEASNNGSIGGSILPTIAFGIPGSSATAVLLAGLLLHGLRPGPSLFGADAHITYAMLLSVLVGNLVILFVGLVIVTRASLITKLSSETIIPMVIVLAMLGGISFRNNWIDVITIVVLGLLGYVMIRNDYSVIAFVLGIILGPIAEENLVRSLQISEGSFAIFVARPISLLLFAAFVAILLVPLLSSARTESTGESNDPESSRSKR